mgnify:CR=1 FL=1
MLSSASLIGAVVSAVLALGPVSAPTKGTDRADEPSHPVMRIALTTSTGSPTELASAGLDKLPLSSGQASGRPLNPLNLWLSEQNDAKKSSAATPSAKEGSKEKSIFQKFTPDILVYKINYFIFAPDLRATK